MLSAIPIDQGKINSENLDKQMLRAAIIGELDAINLYEQMADMTKNGNMKKVLMDIAMEEKTHVGELHSLLVMADYEQSEEMEKGKKEVDEMIE